MSRAEGLVEGALDAYDRDRWRVRLAIEDDGFFDQDLYPNTSVFYIDVWRDGVHLGRLDIVATPSVRGGELWLLETHIHGMSPGRLGRAGLNAICSAVLEELGCDAIVIEGSARSTGARPAHTPKRFRYSRHPRAQAGGAAV